MIIFHVLCLFVVTIVGAYRPVIIFHGIFADAQSMEGLVKMIQTASPGTQVHNIDGFDDVDSMKPMWEQVDSIKSKMLPFMMNETDGVHLICFSQGMFLQCCIADLIKGEKNSTDCNTVLLLC